MKIRWSIILIPTLASRLQAQPILNEEYLLGRGWIGENEALTFNEDGSFFAYGPFGSLGSGTFQIVRNMVLLTPGSELMLSDPFEKQETLACHVAEDSRRTNGAKLTLRLRMGLRKCYRVGLSTCESRLTQRLPAPIQTAAHYISLFRSLTYDASNIFILSLVSQFSAKYVHCHHPQ